jgi:hypothetical protein
MENPTDFLETKQFDRHRIELVNTIETSMGGPRIGNLIIDGEPVRGKFGGPFVGRGNILFIPKLRFKFSDGRFFDLCIFNILTRTSKYVSMRSTGFGVMGVDDQSITLISGLDGKSVWTMNLASLKLEPKP